MVKKLEELIVWEQIIAFVLIIFATIVVAQILRYILSSNKIKNEKLLTKNPTRVKFYTHVITAAVYILGIVTALSQIGVLKSVSTSLLAGAGLVTVAVSFAAQNALSNIISGFFIVIFKPFGINDRLKFRETVTGVVEDITLRHTIIRDGDNRRVIIPNALINNEVVVNYDFHKENINKTLEIILHHSSDIRAAKNVIRKFISGHPLYLEANTERSDDMEAAIPIHVSNITEKGIFCQVGITGTNIIDANKIGYDLLETLAEQLPAHGAWFSKLSDIEAAKFSFKLE
ncbi:MAG: mechanosensitive ion channel [Saprospiraceae bacterium]|nr:mechanosensitive ion channel [Saprospiraceae bacterium]